MGWLKEFYEGWNYFYDCVLKFKSTYVIKKCNHVKRSNIATNRYSRVNALLLL